MERDGHEMNHCVKSLRGGIKAMATIISTATSVLLEVDDFKTISAISRNLRVIYVL